MILCEASPHPHPPTNITQKDSKLVIMTAEPTTINKKSKIFKAFLNPPKSQIATSASTPIPIATKANNGTTETMTTTTNPTTAVRVPPVCMPGVGVAHTVWRTVYRFPEPCSINLDKIDRKIFTEQRTEQVVYCSRSFKGIQVRVKK